MVKLVELPKISKLPLQSSSKKIWPNYLNITWHLPIATTIQNSTCIIIQLSYTHILT
jgi:hypothetical protein